MLGVITGACAAGESKIVARALALVSQLFRGSPHQWMEPVNGARKATERMPHQIMPLYVRQLVQQHRATAVCIPAFTIRRKNNCRLQESAGKRHLRIIASEKTRRLFELETIG